MTPKTLCVMLLVLSVCIHSCAVHHPGKRLKKRVFHKDMSAEITGSTYEVQHAKHKCVNAIKFRTGDRQICAHPDRPWVKNLMARMKKTP